MYYDGAIMTDRTKIALEKEMQRRVHQDTCEVVRPEATADVARVFDLGSSGGSNIAREKDQMIVEAFCFIRWNPRRG